MMKEEKEKKRRLKKGDVRKGEKWGVREGGGRWGVGERRGVRGEGGGREGGGRTGICHVYFTVNFSYSTDHILSDCKNMSGKAYYRSYLCMKIDSAYCLDLYVMV